MSVYFYNFEYYKIPKSLETGNINSTGERYYPYIVDFSRVI